MLAKLRPKLVNTESFVRDISRWNNGKFSDGVTYDALRSALDLLNKNKKKSHMDALIVIANSWMLLTAGRQLAQVAGAFGCVVKLI